jgi:hypothetical protein
MKGYTTKIAIENYLLRTIASGFTTQLEEWISAAERYIDQMTGRSFVADAVASARLFDGNDAPLLLIDDCVAVTKVEVGNDPYGSSFAEILAIGSNRYFTQPNNHAEIGVPIRKLLLTAQTWVGGVQNHRITAKWGYSATAPEDIKWAATVLAAGICLPGLTGNIGGISSEKIGNYAVTYSNDNQKADHDRALDILKNYQRINL